MNKFNLCVACNNIGMFNCNGNQYCYEHLHNIKKPINTKKEYTTDELQEIKNLQQKIKINNLKILYEKANDIINSLDKKYISIINILIVLNNDALKNLNI